MVFGNISTQNDKPTIWVPGNVTEPPKIWETKESFPVSLVSGLLYVCHLNCLLKGQPSVMSQETELQVPDGKGSISLKFCINISLK